MGNYQTSGPRSSGYQHSDPDGSTAPPGGRQESPLVNRLISEQKKKRGNPVKALHVWPRAVKIERDFRCFNDNKPRGERGDITSFSASSKRRLKFTAANALPGLISQFGMTYHKTTPDGYTVKAHLHAFLVALKRKFPSCKYLWILEFQTRKIPHFHLFLTLPHDTPGLHEFMAAKWHEIAEPDSKSHLRFHRHEENFIAWDMGSGSYLCKYLDKEHQKAVPEGFKGVGRFWGNSRGLVPDPEIVEMADVARFVNDYAPKFIVRTLCRYHERSIRRSPWKSSARTRPTSYTLQNAALVARRLLHSLATSPPPEPFTDLPF